MSTPMSGEAVLAKKMGLLNFIGAAGLPPAEVLLLYSAAAANPQDAVARRGEELQKKQCPYDTSKPAVDLEDAGELVHSFDGAGMGSFNHSADTLWWFQYWIILHMQPCGHGH